MNIQFDRYNQPEPPKIYLGTPNNKRICALTGIDESSFKITRNFNNADEILFDIFKTTSYRNVLSNNQFGEKNNAFTLLSLYMRIHLERYGWFIIDPPEENNDSYDDKYTITAQSADIEFQQHNIRNLKINQGTTDSYEMLVDGNVQMVGDVEFAKEQIKFYNPQKPELSFLDIVLKVAGVSGWTIGEVDNIPKTYKYFDEGVQKEKQVCLADEIGAFDVDSTDLYSFLTQDVAKFFNCVFVFDYDNFKINVYHPENYGHDTNVNISFRNFQKSNSIKIDDSNIFTRYYVQGSDELGIEYVNFGSNIIENIDHFLNERYLSSGVITKYKLWKSDVESKRNSYIEYTRLYNAQFSKISELKNKVPLDDCSTDWATFSDDNLTEAKENYEAQLKGYESYYVDENGDFDEDALENSVDADDYHQIKDVILPSIEIEMNNRNLPSGQESADYIDSYKTDWKLYGLDELDNKLQWYKKQKKLAEDEKCDVPYSDESTHTETYHNELYQKYLEAVSQLDPDNSDSCQSYYNNIKQKVDDATKLQDEYDKERKNIAKSVEKESWNYSVSTSQDTISFTQEELEELSRIYIDGDYSNDNMFLTTSDDSVTAIDEQLKLLDAAEDDLYITSHPQYQYSTDLDNFIGLYEYKDYTEKLNLGDYLYLSPKDNEVVKLRIISMDYNPFEYDNDLQITFSNMIQSKSYRNDVAYLLNQSGGSSKNSSTGSSSSNNYLNNEGVSLTPALIQKLVQSGAFQNQLNQIINNNFGSYIGGSISVNELNSKMIKVVDLIGENGFFEYLQAKLISADTIVADSGNFKNLQALVANIDNLLAGNISSELAHIIKLTAENVHIDEAVIRDLIAANITVSMLKASDIDTDKFHVKSSDGSLEIVGNTMQFRDRNNVIRIQIGRDSNDNFTFCLYDETGKGVLIDSSGVKESAISDGLIKNDMVADGTLSKEKFNFNIAECDENGNIDAGKVLINGKGIDVEFTSIRETIESIQSDISELEPSFNIVVANENQNIPCTNTGLTSIAMLIEIPFMGYIGLTQTSCTASVGLLPSGITVGEITNATESSGGKIVLNVAQGSNLGGDNVLNGSIIITFKIKDKTVTKNFTWTKTKSGTTGKDARLYTLDSSTFAIKKNTDDTLLPSSITFSSYYRDGESTVKYDYSGRFLIAESTDGLTYDTKYSSQSDEQSVTYTPTASSISSIRCILCASGGFTNELDAQTVIILTDADGVNEKIKNITETVSGVSTKVDAATKSITDKVWQSDITNSIDNYDKTTIKTIRDQQTEQSTSIDGIKTYVSDVESKLEKKADGTTVSELSEKVTKNEQTAEGFRQEVVKNYVTNDTLSNYATNEQMKTAIKESADSITLSAEKTFASKSESVISSVVKYYVSDSNTSLSGGEWSEESPTWSAGKYIWSKTVITKADGTTSESVPACIQGAKGENGVGEKGEAGRGISSITPQYYLSSSKTSLSDGSWIDSNAPTWESGKYMWTRNKIAYNNPTSTEYTEPYCDTSWDAANEVRSEFTVRVNEIDSKVEDNKKNITEIKQTNEEIQQSVADTNNNITKLQQDASSFKQEVKKTYLTANALKIGGRNLKLNGNFKNGTYGYGTEGASLSVINDATYKKCAQIVFTTSYANERIYTADYTNRYNLSDTTYTVSFIAKASANTKLNVYRAGTAQFIGAADLTTEWKRFEMTYTATSTGSVTFKLNSAGTLYLTNIKIEKGNFATDWTPAPEDSLASVSVEYYLSTSETSLAGGSWTTTAPAWVNGKYMWSRTVMTDGAGNKTYSPSRNGVCIAGAKGDSGKGIKSTAVTYQAGASGTTAPTGTWTSSVPATSADKPYLWTRIIITYTDNTTSTSYSVGSTPDSISVGGRNLLIGSHKNAVNYSYPTDNSYLDAFKKTTSIPLNGDTYTLSFWAKSTNDGDKFRVYFYNPSNIKSFKSSQGYTGTASDGRCPFILTKTLTKYWVTYIIPKGENATRNIIIPRLYGSDRSESDKGTGTITVQWEKLEEGNIATDWTPAPEDFDTELYTLQSEFNQRADSIEMSISKKQDSNITAVRYIRDWLNGNNIDNKNYWLECMAITNDGDNIIDTSTLSVKNKSLNTITQTNLNVYKDENLCSSTTSDDDGNTIYKYIENDHVINSENSCIEVDLGKVYNNIDYIRIWHRFADGNYIFNHKLQLSIDGITWVTLYDSEINGGYEECEDGKIYYLNGSSVVTSMNKLSMTLEETRSQISNTEGGLSSLTQTVDDINLQVSKNYDDANSALEKIRNDLDTKIEEANKALADFKVEADSIYATVSTVDSYNNALASQIKQSSSGWEALFAQLSMGENKDKYNVQTNIKLDVNGITVTNPITGQTTQMTIDQFCGLYNGEKVFWVEKDTTKTKRLLCEKGWDTDYIKMTTNAYNYEDGTILKGVSFVKSGGNS